MNQIDFFNAKLQFEIDACDLKNSIDRNDNIYQIVDARSERAFRQEHIKGAISLPHVLMDKESVKHLDRNMIYVTYCDKNILVGSHLFQNIFPQLQLLIYCFDFLCF